MLFPYFAYIEHFTKLTRGSFLFKEKFLLMEKSKSEESRRWKKKKKKKKKKNAQRRKKEYQSVKKRKRNSFVKAIRTGGAQFRFWTKKSPSNQNLPYILLKTRFPFLLTSLDTKKLTLASNRNFESCMSIRCFAPQHNLQFFHFCRGFFLRLWELCSSLCRPP